MIVFTVRDGEHCLVATSLDGQSSVVRLPNVVRVFGDDASSLIRPLIAHHNKLAFASQFAFGARLERLAVRSRGLCTGRLPRSAEEWQQYLIALFRAWFTENTNSLPTKISTWRHTAFWFTLLRDSTRLIPYGVDIPLDGNNSLRLDDEPGPHLLGELPFKAAGYQHQKVVMEISLVRSDAEYMDEIRSTLSRRRGVLESAAAKWVQMIDAHFRYGQRLMSSIDYEKDLKPYLDSSDSRRDWNNKGAHKASGDTEQSLGLLLWLLRDKTNITKELFDSENAGILPWYRTLTFPKTIPPVVSPMITKSHRLRWMLGILTPTDYSFANLFLTIHHPIFFGSAFFDAKITSRQGEQLITLGDSGMTVNLVKNRSHAMKSAEIDEPSRKCLQMILEMTAPTRLEIAKKSPLMANRLVLIRKAMYEKQMSPILGDWRRINRAARISDYFESVAKEFEGTRLTMRKVRATEGVLEWLTTGSLLAATRRLGNSKQILIEHYIPQELLASFYARQTRRYHNLFLAAATPSEIPLNEILEFKSLEEVHNFLETNLKTEPFGSSPLANFIRKKRSSKKDDREIGSSNEMILPVSENSVAALLLYQECAIETGFNNSTMDESVARGLKWITPDDIISLAGLARFRLADDRDPRMREAFAMGVKRCKKLKETYKLHNLMMRGMNR
jgi:hypothetical protein